MTTEADELLHTLATYTGDYRRDLVQSIVSQREALEQPLLRMFEERIALVEAGQALPPGDSLVFRACFVFGHWKTTAAFPLLLRLLRLPIDDIDELIGDVLTEHMGGILATTFAGSTQGLAEIVLDVTRDTFVRSTACLALALVANTRPEFRPEVIEVGRGALRLPPSDDEDLDARTQLVCQLLDMQPVELRKEIEEQFDQGLIADGVVSREDAHDFLETLTDYRYHLPEDIHEDLGTWEGVRGGSATHPLGAESPVSRPRPRPLTRKQKARKAKRKAARAARKKGRRK